MAYDYLIPLWMCLASTTVDTMLMNVLDRTTQYGYLIVHTCYMVGIPTSALILYWRFA